MKNQNLQTLLLLFLFISIFLNSCKEDFKNRETIYISKETKDFCSFKKGTWWEYINITTNELDTWKISDSFVEIILADETSINNQELITMNVKSNLKSEFEYSIQRGLLKFVTTKFNGLIQPSYTEASFSVGVCDNNNLSLLNTDSLNNECILKEFLLGPSHCTDYFPIHTKWVKNIGMSECIYFNGDTLKLVSYNVIQ